MMYRTEMGLYYSYFKQMVHASTLREGVESMTHDNLTEYPTTINALQRFNLLPEILTGVAYKIYLKWCDLATCPFNHVCYRINRGADLEPTTSCEGLGVPIYFYTHSAFEVNALLVPLTFLICVIINNSIGAGVIGALAFLYNFGEATRVMWTPPLRETWTFPAIHLHLFAITCLVKLDNYRRGWKWKRYGVVLCQLVLFSTTVYSLASWQFSHFNFSVAITAVSALHVLQLIHERTFVSFLIPTSFGYFLVLSVMRENTMMWTSAMLMTIISAWLLVLFQRQQSQKTTESLLYRVFAPVLIWVNTFVLKQMITSLFGVSDEMHILNILRSKFSNFRDFHTLLYVCAKEFDFLGWEYVNTLTQSAVLPLAVLCVTSLTFLTAVFILTSTKSQALKCGPIHFNLCPAVLLHLLLFLGYGLMATLIMRLKLFFTPQICILSTFVLLPPLVKSLNCCLPKLKLCHLRLSLAAIVVLMMSYNGYPALNRAMERYGEYSDAELEYLLEWIMKNTDKDDSFAGSMSTMATIRLTTGRPIVNHPHYEDTLARERNKLVYRAFGRFPAEDIHETMVKLSAKYLLLEVGWCWAKRAPGCSIAEAFDVEYPELSGKEPTCIGMRKRPHPFTIAYQNRAFTLLKT
ncbi:protein C-mannosyl-transferase DPY19L1-like isoform X2 [Convolutriloba macropyga]